MSRIVQVKRINVKVILVKQMLKANDMSIDDIAAEESVRKYFEKECGINFNQLKLSDCSMCHIDAAKLIAVDEIEDIPGIEGIRGFAVWFGIDAQNDIWYISEEYYQTVLNAFKEDRVQVVDGTYHVGGPR